jgi:hypothetical protein
MKKQRGIGFLGIFFICMVIVLGSIAGMKIVPAYLEYFAVKDSIKKVKESGANTVADIQRAYDKQANINNIKAISATDLDIVRGDTGDSEISFAYPVKIHMFNNVFVCIDFAATTAPGGLPPPPEK